MIPVRLLSLFLFVTILVMISNRVYCRYFSEDAVIYFWDVGQGDSALIKLPLGKTFLVDAGGGWGEWRMGSELVSELARLGVLNLNGIVLSHFDSDHVQGAIAILKKLKVEKLWYSGFLGREYENKRSVWTQIRAEASRQKTELTPIFNNTSLSSKNVRFHFHAISSSRKMKANDGLAFGLEIYGCRFLFMGDLDEKAENQLESPFNSPAAVLKVAHHGSKTSSHWAWLKKVRPRFAVISAGLNNRYGHPHPSVVNRLVTVGSKVLRTDINGYIAFRISSQGVLTCQSAEGSNCGVYYCQ
jgi:competence protein ComEC